MAATNIKKIVFAVILIVVALPGNCFAQKNIELITQFDTTNFQLSFDKKDIPSAFKNHYESVSPEKFTIANPQEDFARFDDFGYNVPRTHLIVTCTPTTDGLYFLYYEVIVSGVELRSFLFIFKCSKRKIVKEIVLMLPNDVRDYVTLKQSVKDHHFTIVSDI